MARSTPLLVFSLLVILIYAENVTASGNASCSILNTTQFIPNSNFSLFVSPAKYYVNAWYRVKVNGTGNVTVILQALVNSKIDGNWSQGNSDCDGRPVFVNPFKKGNNSLTANWTSPNRGESVIISVFIQNGKDTHKISGKIPPTRNVGSAKHPSSTVMLLLQSLGLLFVFCKLI